MKKTPWLFAIITLPLIVITGCSKENNGGGGGTTVNCSLVTNKAFAADVNPVIQTVCAAAGCHANGSSNGPGALTNYAQVFSARAQIRSAVSSGLMPQGSTLSSSQKNSILCWIDSGAPNN